MARRANAAFNSVSKGRGYEIGWRFPKGSPTRIVLNAVSTDCAIECFDQNVFGGDQHERLTEDGDRNRSFAGDRRGSREGVYRARLSTSLPIRGR